MGRDRNTQTHELGGMSRGSGWKLEEEERLDLRDLRLVVGFL